MDTATDTQTKWKIDQSHSEIQFKVKHLVISTVTGKFTSFDAEAESSEDSFENAEVYFEADVDSVDTGNEDRDQHLKSDDFFNAEEHPKLTFRSTSMENTGENEYRLTGDLTIRGTTNEITLDVNHGGTVEDPYGNTKAGFELSGTLNRKDYGLQWDAVTEAGNVVVGDKVKLILNVQFIQG
ncbi:MAG: YceI family protein [Balneolaceae bacterium]|nr:YceI family protein [Balneolaceae bacterium]